MVQYVLWTSSSSSLFYHKMDNNKSSDKKAKGSEESGRKAFSFEFNKVKFPSKPLDDFRVNLTSSTDAVVMWIESKKSKQQWQATITKFDEAVFKLVFGFQKALKIASGGAKDGDDPVVDLNQNSSGEMVLTLTLNMGGI